jgi:uncharacterized membrane protein
MKDFSITNLFLVTGLSFLGFTAGLKFLDGETNPFLLKVGLIALGMGVISFLINFLLKKWDAKNSRISTDGE